MIDLNSQECIIRAATLCRDKLAERIASNPADPINPGLQLIADRAQQIINDNERRASDV